MSHLIDLTGQRFGRLVVIDRAPTKPGCSNARWRCKCDCGNETVVIGSVLRRRESTSCGCYRADYWREHMTTHGEHKSKAARTWYHIKQRCYNKNLPSYKNYGGRGIAVCDEWLSDYEAFRDYVTKLPHYGEEGRSFDRINNDGNYEPGNVRWATAKEQSNNRRCVKKHGIKLKEV